MSRPPGVWLFFVLNIFAGLFLLLRAIQTAWQIETVFSLFFAGSSFVLSFNVVRLNRLAHVGCAVRLLLLLWAGLFRHSLPTQLAACALLAVLLSKPVRNAFWKGTSAQSAAEFGLRSAKNYFKRLGSDSEPGKFDEEIFTHSAEGTAETGIRNMSRESVRRAPRQSSFRFKQ